MIMKCDLHVNAFSNDRFIMARALDRIHYPLLVLAHSLLVLVSFAAARAGARNALRPLAWTFILSPVHIKNVEV